MHTPKRILVIENNIGEGAFLQSQLKKNQLQKHLNFINDGGVALAYLTEPRSKCEELAAVFLDLHLPTVDGLRILETIRSDDRLHNLSVIVITSSNSPEELERCRELGVSNYVDKPLTLSSFAKAFADSFHARRVSAGRVATGFANA